MQTKLTLRMDSSIIALAKAQAAKRGKSLSQLVADYIAGLRSRKKRTSPPVTPLVGSLRGILKGKIRDPQKAWRQHLKEKYG
jgi:hypothetical protein